MLQTLYYLSALSVHHFSIFIFDSLPIEHQFKQMTPLNGFAGAHPHLHQHLYNQCFPF